MGFKNYDNWKLATPWDNERDIEVFQTKRFFYYHTDEKLVEKFDNELKLLEENSDDLESLAESLADEIGLFNDDYKAIEAFLEMEQSEKEYKQECYWQAKKELENE